MAISIVNIKSGAKYDVYCGRGSIFGNPYTHIKHKQTLAEFIVDTREESIEKYKTYFLDRIEKDKNFKREVLKLKGKTCACFCWPQHCHLEVIRDWLQEYFDNYPF